MKRLNQVDILRRYRRQNIVLTLILLALLTWVAWLFYQEIEQKQRRIEAIVAEKTLRIEREKDTLIFQQKNGRWRMTAPFSSLASTTVIEAFLQRLHGNCQTVDTQALSRELQFYALVKTAHNNYQIGEVNPVTDSVYVKTLSPQGEFRQLALCDKLLVSMALAPAINFIDKQLYHGELTEIRGSFGAIRDFAGIDLSVLEVAAANSQQAESAGVSDLTFISTADGEQLKKTYRVLPTDNQGRHLLLFEPQKSLIYVIAGNAKIHAILGL